MEKKLFESAIGKLREIIERDERFRTNTYLVGGCVRDLLLGETPKDIDLCIDYQEGSTEFIKYLEKNYPRSEVSGFTVFQRYGTSRFTLHLSDGNVEIECVIPRTESYNNGPRKPDQVSQTSIQEDAMRRDFCCNALYKNLESGDILDPTEKGYKDLEDRILRTPLDPEQTFKDDPLRMLRAIRFACTKGFKIEENTKNNIKYYTEYGDLSMERIQDEFNKILMSQYAEEGIRELIRSHLILRIIPEFWKYSEFDQHSKYHSMSWLEHTLSVLRVILKNNPRASLELRLAALLHDISKPTIYKIKDDGQYSYHNHEIDSSERARKILVNLKYPLSVINKVCFLVENHMIIKSLYSYKTHTYTGKPKKTRKIIRETGDNLEELMELIEADNLSHAKEWNMPGQVESFWEEVERIKSEPETSGNNTFTAPINGDDILNFLMISPGKLVREVKNILQDYYDDSPGLEKEELLDKYSNEFSEVVWFAKGEGDYYYVFSNKPVKKGSSFWWSNDTDLPYKVKKNDINYEDIVKKELMKVSAMYCPEIYRKFRRKQRIDQISKKLGCVITELNFIDGFEKLTLNYDGGDLYMKFKFSDNEELEIC